MKKRILALILCLTMVFSLMPTAFAAEDEPSEAEDIIETAEASAEDSSAVASEVENFEADDAPKFYEVVKLSFELSPENAAVSVYADADIPAEEREAIEPQTDGTYLLAVGEYVYNAECEGYAALVGEKFSIDGSVDSMSVTVVLSVIEATAEAKAFEAPEETSEEAKTSESSEAADNTAEAVDEVLLEDESEEEKMGASGFVDIDSGTCGENLTWRIWKCYQENGSYLYSTALSISGKGEMYDYASTVSSHAPWKEYSQQIDFVYINDGVTSIGAFAFYGMLFDKIEIADTVTSIGESAFASGGINSGITLPGKLKSIGDSAFYHNNYIEDIVIPQSVTFVGNAAFKDCANLKSINFGRAKSIGNSAFEKCTALTNVTIPSSVSSIGDSAFRGCTSLASINIPSSVTSIGDSAFIGCSSLASINIPSSVTSIGDSAFWGCSSLASINIPSSVTSIGDSAFWGCSSLASINIPSSVTSVSDHAFYDCSALASINIPSSVTSIGDSAFWGCSSLTGITIPSSVTSIGDSAFGRCSSLTGITIPSSVTSIGGGAFGDCEKLASVRIEDCLDEAANGIIGEFAFSGCKALTEVSIGNGIEVIGDSAFSECSSLVSLIIGNGVAEIGNRAFDNCSSLTSVFFPRSVKSVVPVTKSGYSYGSFENCDSLKYIFYEGNEADCILSAKSVGNVFPNVHYNCEPGQLECLDENCTLCGSGFTWSIDGDVLTISGTGRMPDYEAPGYNDSFYDASSSTSPWAESASMITSVVISEGVTSIGRNAFYKMINLCSISIPDTVTSIGRGAFFYCYNLDSVEIPYGVISIDDYSFTNCRGLRRIEIPNSVMRIGTGAFELAFGNYWINAITIPESVIAICDNAFKGCWTIPEVIMQNGITSIGNSVFEGCNHLKHVEIPSSVVSFGSGMFKGCSALEAIPENIRINEEMFRDCSSLESVVIPDDETDIPYGAFSGCSSLIELVIPNGITAIGSWAFDSCVSLSNINLPDSLTEISEGAFCKCKNLTEINIPYGVEIIPTSAFIDCVGLKKIILPGTITEIGRNAFGGCILLDNVTLPDGLTAIDGAAFAGCKNLKSLVIPENVTSIDSSAFSDCSALKSINLPSGLSTIEAYTFNDCESLESIDLPQGITEIKECAFKGCSRMTTVTLPESVIYIRSQAFADCENLTEIYIPANCNSRYSFSRTVFENSGLQTVRYGGSKEVWDSMDVVLPNGTNVVFNAVPCKHVSDEGTVTKEASAAEEGIKTYTCTLCGIVLKNESIPKFYDELKITAQPTDTKVCPGAYAVFGITAEGSGLSYQWQYKKPYGEWTALENVTSSRFEMTASSEWMGCSFRCVVTDAAGTTVISDEAALIEDNSIVITEQPKNAVANVDDIVSFSVEATGSGLSYQWQRRSENSSVWSDFSTSRSFGIKASNSFNRNYFRCIITDGFGNSVISDEAILVLASEEAEELYITAQPLSQIVGLGAAASFKITATGTCLKYQWQTSSDDGITWVNCVAEGYDSANYIVRTNSDSNGRMYRCIVSNINGESITSDAAKLVLNTEPAITKQPVNQSAAVGETVCFKVAANGIQLRYQWQESTDYGWSWTDCTGTGADTAEYSFTASSELNYRQYRCVVMDYTYDTASSNAATLYVFDSLPVITTQPENQTVPAGNTVRFEIKASFAPDVRYTGYQWQMSSDNGDTWTNCYYSNDGVYSFIVSKAHNGRMYRCVVSGTYRCETISDAVVLTVTEPIETDIVIIKQPVSVAADDSEFVSFNIEATGSGLCYQWQYKELGETTWVNMSTGSQVGIKASSFWHGASFRCIVSDAYGKNVISDEASFTLNGYEAALYITTQPASQTVNSGSTIKFTVVAVGDGLTYQWQYKTATGTTWSNSGSTGNKTDTLSVGATAARNGFSFRCVITDENGKSVTSETATLTVNATAPVITKQPVSVTADLDSTAKFTVAASGDGLTYQWQYKTAIGTTWSNSGSTGSKTDTLSVGATAARNGYSFRCVIKDENGESVISDAATLTVNVAPLVITKQPVSVTADLDSTAKFTVAASGDGLTYQWQYKTATGTAWSNSGSTGSKTDTLSVGATAARNGFSFRCVIKDENGESVISDAATLTVNVTPLVITKQPVSVTADLDSTAKFTVAASGDGLTYQWQYKTAAGTTWSNSGSTGSKTATLSVGATNARNGYSFRCVVKDASGKSVISEAAKLTVNSGAPVITTQPVSVTAALDSTVKFTIAASGDGLSYQWQYKTATGTTWSNSGSTGNKTATLSVGATNARNGFSFRCVVKDANGKSAISNAVTLTVSGGAPVITTQPVSVTAALDSTVKFTVAASGDGLSYQWQYKTATGTTWSNSGSTGNKTATLSVGATTARNGFSFRCVIKDANGKSAISNAVTLTVSGGAPVITKQPVSVTAALDSTVKFTVAASGDGLTYQWQYKTATGSTWSNSGSTGNKTATLSVGATNARNGFSFRCVIKDANGKSAISNAVTLTVDSNGAPVITEQPVSVTAALDSTAKFTVAASGDGLTYQWQYKTATGTTWSNSGSTGNKTATLSVGATNARNGFSFRCVIKDANGATVISSSAKLTVN